MEASALVSADDVEGEGWSVGGRVPVGHQQLEDAAAHRFTLLQSHRQLKHLTQKPLFHSLLFRCSSNQNDLLLSEELVFGSGSSGSQSQICRTIHSAAGRLFTQLVRYIHPLAAF